VLHSFGNQIARVKKLMSMWWAMKNKNGCAWKSTGNFVCSCD
jgi:hypothetical protein